jgi:NitT/TauT family transport system permease protein
MWKRTPTRRAGFSLPDVLALGLLMALLAGFVVVAQYWTGPLSPPPPVDLSLRSLPYALFLSLSRIVLAYLVCLLTSLAIGYWAAHSRTAEKIIVPLIDIGQSIPVVGFLPGFVLIFLSLFPESRVGLEIACILTLYTGMAWNLMLSFYGSIKTIPREYVDIIRAYGYGRLGVLFRLELPYSMNGIVWNSMLSVAGGWFFLTVCETYTLGDQSFRLVGLGTYMSLAAERGDVAALLVGGGSMLLILYFTDMLVWRPLLRWAERFQRMNPTNEEESDEPVLNFFAKSKRITHFLRKIRRRYAVKLYVNQKRGRKQQMPSRDWTWFGYLVLGAFVLVALWGVYRSVGALLHLSVMEWIELFRAALFTSTRVLAVLIISALIMLPLGIWIGSQPHLVKRLQSTIQILAGFPAPMVFPMLMPLFAAMSLPMGIGAVLLMLTGAQWYLLFNVIGGVAGVPENLLSAAKAMGASRWDIVRRVYLPAAFPSILTGFITAAGGAWNVSIVAELVVFRGKVYATEGLGSYITRSAESADYVKLTAAILLMVVIIVLINRLIWARLYSLAENRYRLDS